MGQKVNPNGIRLGITRTWNSRWYVRKKDYPEYLYTDIKVRKFVYSYLKFASIGNIEIERQTQKDKTQIRIYSAKPGTIIGRKSNIVEELKNNIYNILKTPIDITIQEIRKPDLNPKLVAESVAQQLEKRLSFRRAIKKSIQAAMRQGAKGIKISVSGRLSGAELARTEWDMEGRVPLHTFRANIDYSTANAMTTYGIIGIKVWIFKGELYNNEKFQITSSRDGNNLREI